MYLTGFADEASATWEGQIKATKALGWKYIETRKLFDGNLSNITDAQFEQVQKDLEENGIKFNAYGSAIANWSHPITDEAESSYEEMRRVIPRMHKLGMKYVRIMSFNVPDAIKPQSWDYADEVIKRVTNIVKMAEDAGIICLHENCMNWGGLSYEHTLYLLDKIKSPAFRLVFDTGNPAFNLDCRGEVPYTKKQNAWEFYVNVREFIEHIHIKDGYYPEQGGEFKFTFAGEGDGCVKQILKDLCKRGYDGGISIEPHVATVFHDTDDQDNSDMKEQRKMETYIEYGKALQQLVIDAGFKL